MARLAARTATREDIEAIVALNEAVFQQAEMTGWRPHHVEAHLGRFQQGQIVAELDGEVRASSTSLLVREDAALEPHTWMSITGGNELPRHDPEGDWLYGLEIAVHPSSRGLGLAQLLYRARKVVARSRGLEGIAIGGRMPGYESALKDEGSLPPSRYVEQVEQGARTDPVLTPQIAAGFTPRRVLENYVVDPPSLHHAVLLTWTS